MGGMDQCSDNLFIVISVLNLKIDNIRSTLFNGRLGVVKPLFSLDALHPCCAKSAS